MSVPQSAGEWQVNVWDVNLAKAIALAFTSYKVSDRRCGSI